MNDRSVNGGIGPLDIDFGGVESESKHTGQKHRSQGCGRG